MESQSEGVEDISTLLVHGSEVGADGAERIGAVFCSEAAGDFLFDLGHTNGLFGEVVGEGDIVIGGESPDIVGVEAQAQEQVGGLALSRSAPVARFRSGGGRTTQSFLCLFVPILRIVTRCKTMAPCLFTKGMTG